MSSYSPCLTIWTGDLHLQKLFQGFIDYKINSLQFIQDKHPKLPIITEFSTMTDFPTQFLFTMYNQLRPDLHIIQSNNSFIHQLIDKIEQTKSKALLNPPRNPTRPNITDSILISSTQQFDLNQITSIDQHVSLSKLRESTMNNEAPRLTRSLKYIFPPQLQTNLQLLDQLCQSIWTPNLDSIYQCDFDRYQISYHHSCLLPQHLDLQFHHETVPTPSPISSLLSSSSSSSSTPSLLSKSVSLTDSSTQHCSSSTLQPLSLFSTRSITINHQDQTFILSPIHPDFALCCYDQIKPAEMHRIITHPLYQSILRPKIAWAINVPPIKTDHNNDDDNDITHQQDQDDEQHSNSTSQSLNLSSPIISMLPCCCTIRLTSFMRSFLSSQCHIFCLDLSNQAQCDSIFQLFQNYIFPLYTYISQLSPHSPSTTSSILSPVTPSPTVSSDSSFETQPNQQQEHYNKVYSCLNTLLTQHSHQSTHHLKRKPFLLPTLFIDRRFCIYFILLNEHRLDLPGVIQNRQIFQSILDQLGSNYIEILVQTISLVDDPYQQFVTFQKLINKLLIQSTLLLQQYNVLQTQGCDDLYTTWKDYNNHSTSSSSMCTIQ